LPYSISSEINAGRQADTWHAPLTSGDNLPSKSWCLIKLMPLIQILSNNNLVMNSKDYFLVSKYFFLKYEHNNAFFMHVLHLIDASSLNLSNNKME
jgi:hypothetical protein